jgi:hypothetical protein
MMRRSRSRICARSARLHSSEPGFLSGSPRLGLFPSLPEVSELDGMEVDLRPLEGPGSLRYGVMRLRISAWLLDFCKTILYENDFFSFTSDRSTGHRAETVIRSCAVRQSDHRPATTYWDSHSLFSAASTAPTPLIPGPGPRGHGHRHCIGARAPNAPSNASVGTMFFHHSS